MKRTLIISFAGLLVVSLLLVVFTSSRATTTSPSAVGRVAPKLTLSTGDTTLTLESLRGKTVLLSFWSSADPKSRMANARYSRVLDGNDDIVFVSLNFDRSENIFRMMLEADALPAANVYFCQRHERPAIKRAWKIGDEFNAYLIAPSGKIVEVNPTKVRRL